MASCSRRSVRATSAPVPRRYTVGAVTEYGAETEFAQFFGGFGIHCEGVGGVEFRAQRFIPGISAFFIGQWLGLLSRRAAHGLGTRQTVTGGVEINESGINGFARAIGDYRIRRHCDLQAASLNATVAHEQGSAVEVGFIIDINGGVGKGEQARPLIGSSREGEGFLGKDQEG